MPVVRELINRISFKVNPADKKNAETAFNNLKAQGAGAVAAFGGIGGAAKKALTAIGLLTAAGTKMFTEFESNKAVTRFFSRSIEEANQLSDIVNKLRGSEIISQRELEQAKASLSTLTVDLGGIDKILPLLAEVTVARPDLDFNQVVGLVTQFVKTGDLDALERLGAINKDVAERFKLAQLNANSAIKGQRNLFEFLSRSLLENEEKIRSNADAVRDDLGFAFKEVGKQASDFTLKFGKETSGQVKETVQLVRDMLKELNESTAFWEGLRETITTINTALKGTIALAKLLSGDTSGTIEKNKQREIEETKRRDIALEDAGLSLDLPMGEFLSRGFQQLIGGINTSSKSFAGASSEAAQSLNQTSVNLSGEIKVIGQNLQGLDTADMAKQITDRVISKVSEGFKNVAAQSGRQVSAGGL